MQEKELIDNFIRIERVENGINILVSLIEWEGPHAPITNWVIGANIPAEASKIEIQKATTAIIEDPTYFCKCTECDERIPVGWMYDEQICQSCAESYHGVIY